MQPVVSLLREIIAIPSVNPAFLPAGDERAGEKALADFLAAVAARAGLDSEIQNLSADRSSLIVRLEPLGRARRRILLAPHLDTVGEPAMPDSMFRPIARGDRLYGRGACDTKGSVAAMLTALLRLSARANRPAQTEVVFAGLADEEFHQAGSRGLVAAGWRADLAIVGEPTRLKVVTAHKGDLWLRLRTRGKMAHGSKPDLGKNAVHSMARIVDLLETDYASELGGKRHPLLGPATVNVGLIRGGTQPNIVPALCEIEVDRRTIPGETEAGITREIKNFLKRHGAPAELIRTKSYSALPLETDPSLPLVRHFLDRIRQRRPAGVDFFCDAAVLARGGIPSVVFGPGDIAQAHTADEWISVRELECGAGMLLDFLQSLP